MSLRAALERAIQGGEVPPAILETAFGEIMEGKASPVAISALLVALRTKGETPGEIVAVARALRARAVLAPCGDPRTVDTCGTGGDGVGSFNVSTAAAFVVAGAGGGAAVGDTKLTLTGALMGTPAYMAPEVLAAGLADVQAARRRVIDPACGVEDVGFVKPWRAHDNSRGLLS